MNIGIEWIIAVILGLSGTIIVAIVQSVKSNKSQKPVWTYKTTHVIGRNSKSPPELKLIFKNNPIENVYETKILFFNDGKAPIDKKDMVIPVRFHFKESKILGPPKVIENREPIGFIAQVKDDNSIGISFKFLSRNDGAVLEVLHTEDDFSDKADGDFKNAKLLIIKDFPQLSPSSFWLYTIKIATPMIISGFFFAMGGPGLTSADITRVSMISRFLSWLVASVFLFWGSALWTIYRFSKLRRLPQWSRKYFE
jgi:hypothetical protein